MKKFVFYIILITLMLISSAYIYYIDNEHFSHKFYSTKMVNQTGVVGGIYGDNVVVQDFANSMDYFDEIELIAATYERVNQGNLKVTVKDINNNALSYCIVDLSTLKDNQKIKLKLNKPVEGYKNQNLKLFISSDTDENNAVTVYYGKEYNLAKFSISNDDNSSLYIGNKKIDGILCYSIYGKDNILVAKYYWIIVAVIILLSIIIMILDYKYKYLERYDKYGFLLSQLVIRDFKTKYKRSILGIIWSLLNPILTMLVLYFVFSTIFKSNIPYFIAYLLIGIVCFSFFAEATNSAMGAIVGNASLISKVYVPLEIYPVSRILTAMINLLLSTIPVIVVLLILQVPVNQTIILSIYGILCLIILSFGLGLILAAAYVFFRDMQFLWGIFCSLLMYMTPIFYPATIIPDNLMGIYSLNPLYHIIDFIRMTILQGITPSADMYLACLLSAFIPLLTGMAVFKKLKHKFILFL